MQKNVGTTDKAIRWIIGLAILIAGFYYDTWWGLLGLIPIGNAIFGFCGVYKLLGISTYNDNGADSKAAQK